VTTSPFGTFLATPRISLLGSTPPVSPEIRLMAPGVEGPNVVPKELSLMAKCWA